MATKKTTNNTVVVSKTDDGGVQIMFTLPWAEVSTELTKASGELAKNITVPGFRQGKAPMDVVAGHISREKLVQEVIGAILPPLITRSYKEHSITPVMYPKVELLHAHDGENWEVRVTTAQFPDVDLGDYKKIAKEAISKTGKEAKSEEKENVALRAILDKISLKLPKVLVEEEANQRISNLLSRLEKLGLSLESYLASQKKDAETLRAEYVAQATEAIKAELILGKIAEREGFTVNEPEIDAFGKALAADPQRASKELTPEDRVNIRTILLKRKAIESLVS